MFVKDEIRLLWLFYLSKFIIGFTAVLSAFQIVSLMGKGLSLTQVSVLIAIGVITSIVVDIPTSVVADRYGRKLSVILSYFLIGVTSILVPFVHSFLILIWLFVLWGVSASLFSGAYDAWVVDNIKRKDIIRAYFAHQISIVNLGLIFAPLIGAAIVSVASMDVLWFVEGVGCFVAGALLLLANEKFKRTKRMAHHALRNMKMAFSHGYEHPILFRIIFAEFFLMLAISAGFFLWQPYLTSFSLPIAYLGYVLSVSALLSVVAPLLAHQWAGNRPATYLVVGIVGFIGVFLISGFNNSLWLGMLMMALLYTGVMFITPVSDPLFQEFVPSKMRATIGSVRGTVGALGAALATLLAGILADQVGARYAMLFGVAALLPALFFYISLRRREQSSSP